MVELVIMLLEMSEEVWVEGSSVKLMHCGQSALVPSLVTVLLLSCGKQPGRMDSSGTRCVCSDSTTSFLPNFPYMDSGGTRYVCVFRQYRKLSALFQIFLTQLLEQLRDY